VRTQLDMNRAYTHTDYALWTLKAAPVTYTDSGNHVNSSLAAGCVPQHANDCKQDDFRCE